GEHRHDRRARGCEPAVDAARSGHGHSSRDDVTGAYAGKTCANGNRCQICASIGALDVTEEEVGMRLTPVVAVAAVDPVLRDTACIGAMYDLPGLVVVRHEVDGDTGTMRRLVHDGYGVVEDLTLSLEPLLSRVRAA